MLIKKLVTNVIISSDFGDVTLTHTGMEVVVSAISGGYIKAVVWQGVVIPGVVTDTDLTPDKVFVPYEHTRTEKNIRMEQLRPLRAAVAGKPKDDFRLSDVYNYMFMGISP